jgi:hypothetical protein
MKNVPNLRKKVTFIYSDPVCKLWWKFRIETDYTSLLCTKFRVILKNTNDIPK